MISNKKGNIHHFIHIFKGDLIKRFLNGKL